MNLEYPFISLDNRQVNIFILTNTFYSGHPSSQLGDTLDMLSLGLIYFFSLAAKQAEYPIISRVSDAHNHSYSLTLLTSMTHLNFLNLLFSLV